MCLAVPLRIKELDGTDAVVERDGVSRRVKVNFIREPKVGDYVMVHAGFAMQIVDEKEFEEMNALLAEMHGAPRTVNELGS